MLSNYSNPSIQSEADLDGGLVRNRNEGLRSVVFEGDVMGFSGLLGETLELDGLCARMEKKI